MRRVDRENITVGFCCARSEPGLKYRLEKSLCCSTHMYIIHASRVGTMVSLVDRDLCMSLSDGEGTRVYMYDDIIRGFMHLGSFRIETRCL